MKREKWPSAKGGWCERESGLCVHLPPDDYEQARSLVNALPLMERLIERYHNEHRTLGVCLDGCPACALREALRGEP